MNSGKSRTAFSEKQELETCEELRKQFGWRVPRQVFQYKDGCGDVYHVLVKGRTRELLRVLKGRRLPEWLEILEIAVEVTERFRFEIPVPREHRWGIRGSMHVTTSPVFSWFCDDKHAFFDHRGGYSYCKGKGDSFLSVRITGMSKDRYWEPLVKSLKRQVLRALRGEKVFGIR